MQCDQDLVAVKRDLTVNPGLLFILETIIELPSGSFCRPQTKFAKVIFFHVSVCPRGEGGYLQAHTQQGGWGVWLGGLQAHTRGEVEGSGWVGSPGPHLGRFFRPTPGGVSRPRHWGVSQHALRQTPTPKQTATAAGGTHPTRMHSRSTFVQKKMRQQVTIPCPSRCEVFCMCEATYLWGKSISVVMIVLPMTIITMTVFISNRV